MKLKTKHPLYFSNPALIPEAAQIVKVLDITGLDQLITI